MANYVLDYTGSQVNQKLGESYSLSGGGVEKSNDTTSSFAIEGVVVSVGTGDDEGTLIISSASTSNAVTASGAVTYTAPTLSNSSN